MSAAEMRFTRVFLDTLRYRIRLSDWIGREVRLERRGQEHFGLCPFHDERTPSFTVRDDGRFFHCFGCGAHGDVIEFVRRADGLDFRAAVAKLANEFVAAIPAADNGARPSWVDRRGAEEELLRRIAGARRLWDRGRGPRGTLVEIYLRSRGLTLPPAPVLRWAPSCWNREVQRYLPAMLARVDGPDCKLVAVHRTWLGPDGRKAELHEPKKSLGPICGGAVRLAPAAPVLVIAEGIENALTAIVAKGIPAWSAVSSGGIKGLLLPPVVDEVVIVADHDRNGVGELAARRAGLCDDGGRLVVRCLSGCASRDVHKELCCRHLGGNGRANGNGNGNRVAALETCTEHEAKAVAAAAKRTSRIAAALDIWRNSFPATDTVAETYLASPGTRKPGLQILTRSSPRVLWSATCQRRRRADPPARQRENLSRGQRAAWESRSGDRAAATRAGALRRLQEFAPGSVQP